MFWSNVAPTRSSRWRQGGFHRAGVVVLCIEKRWVLRTKKAYMIFLFMGKFVKDAISLLCSGKVPQYLYVYHGLFLFVALYLPQLFCHFLKNSILDLLNVWFLPFGCYVLPIRFDSIDFLVPFNMLTIFGFDCYPSSYSPFDQSLE